MTRSAYIIIATAICLIIYQSCENDFPINYEPFTPQIVVFGMIDPFAESNQVRVGRVFYGADGIWGSVKNQDSIYFDKLDVSMELTDLNYVYSCIDLIESDTCKSNGTFDNQPSPTYLMDRLPLHAASFVSNQEGFTHLKLQIVSSEILEPCIVIEKIFRKPTILQPSKREKQLRLYSSSNRSSLLWNPSEDCEYHEVSFTLYYSELIDGNVEDRMIKLSFSSPFLEVDGNIQMSLAGDRFMRRVNLKLSGDTIQNVKKLRSITLGIISGSESIKDYVNSYDIAADHNGQPISNVINGLGILGVYTKEERTNLSLTAQGIDSLTGGSITRHLRFVKYDIGE